MRTMNDWYKEYSYSHQNRTNIIIHKICVPLIYFSIVGLIMSIPNAMLSGITSSIHSIFSNWVWIALVLVMLFYFTLSLKVAFTIFIFSVAAILINYTIAQYSSLFLVSLGVFILAWIGQFYGHKLEGKKPSFLKDLQFLLIGPAWVFEQVLFGKKVSELT